MNYGISGCCHLLTGSIQIQLLTLNVHINECCIPSGVRAEHAATFLIPFCNARTTTLVASAFLSVSLHTDVDEHHHIHPHTEMYGFALYELLAITWIASNVHTMYSQQCMPAAAIH
jgi:hypothetical protein